MSQTVEVKNSANQAGDLVKRFISGTGPLLVLLFMVAALWILSPSFRTPTGLMLVGLEAAAIGVVAAGQTFVILTGGIDLSVEAMVSFSGVMAAILIAGTNVAGGQIAFGMPSIAAISITLVLGILIGVFQGLLITAFKLNPLIATLGGRSILMGISLVATRGAGINIQKDAFLTFISGTIDIGSVRVPMPLIIALVIYGVVWFVLNHTKLGRYTYAIGGNTTAARLSGINVNLILMTIYGISGFLSSIGGILVMGRLQSGAYQNGTGLTMMSVAAVVIGGTALSGGIGGIWGTLIGVFIIRVVDAGLVYLDVPSNAKEIVLGVIIVLAVILDVIRRGEITWLRLPGMSKK